ncbi:MAG: hypothetical protein LJE83_06615 [Gammaproteobacteria bacterium]|nr:hypothetical protein [Gammaproteobacteria bacterium]
MLIINVLIKNKLTYLAALSTLILLLWLINKNVVAGNEQTALSLTNFSFASYIGTGFYTVSGQDVYVIQLPFHYTIKEKSDTETGWVLNLPLTIGIINFDNFRDLDFENLPKPDDITTLTFIPGIEYQYPVTADWTLIPFADYGFARDLNHNANVLITACGIKSYANFHLTNGMLTLGNRFLYAREHIGGTDEDSDFSLIETGLNYRIAANYSFSNGPLYTNFYYINFYYPNELVFFERTNNPVHVDIENEVGFTLSNLPDFLFFEKPQIGLGIRTGDKVNVYRLLFSAPF